MPNRGDTERRIRGILRAVRVPIRESGYRLHKRKKLGIFRQHQQQRVTGLVVNAKVQLPRKTRRWLRAVIHNRRQGRKVTLTDHQLLGWLALQQMIQEQRSG